jgi:hypothetical protein
LRAFCLGVDDWNLSFENCFKNMFTVDPNITDLKVKEKSMLKVLFSMNTHQVATPEMSLEDARSYVIFCREGGGKISAYIGLHLLETNRRIFYPHSSNPFPEEDMNAVDEEARGFAEGLGGMLDEIDITKMSSEDKNHWIDEQAIFNLKKQIETKPEEQPEAPVTESPEKPSAPAAQPAAEQAAPAVQPGPAVQQQAPVAPPGPLVQPAPAVQPQEVPAPAAPVNAAPVPPAPEAPPQPPVQLGPPKRTVAAPPQAAQPASAKRPEDIIQRAIKAGVVKAPKPQLKKEISSTNGIVSRDREALARLLSSF